MAAVLLFYAMAFFILGAVLLLQFRSSFRVLPGAPLALLAAFGLLHGVAELLRLFPLMMGKLVQTFLPLATLAVSFVLLLQFGVELGIASSKWSRWTRMIPLLMLGLAFVLGELLFHRLLFLNGAPEPEVLVRYVLAFPAALVAAYAIHIFRLGSRATGRERMLTLIAELTFLGYALFAGLIGPAAAFAPASWINASVFREATGLPIELFRMTMAIALTVVLVEIFVVTADQVRLRLEQLREEFISVVAHDLRNPLQGIALSVAALERARAKPMDEARYEKLLAGIRTRIAALDRLVTDLLDASRIEASRLRLEREPIELRRAIPEIVERLGGLAQGHDVSLSFEGDQLEVEADPMRLEQVLGNLISNAAKYAYPASPIHVEVACARDQRQVRFTVSNHGPAIPPERMEQLFTRFYRAAPATHRKDSLGLGLYIARGLVEGHGGTIWAECAEDEKTRFSFTLPTHAGSVPAPENRRWRPRRLRPSTT